MRYIQEIKVSTNSIMELDKDQNHQLIKILSVYNGDKYEEHTYTDVSNLIVFKTTKPLKKKGLYCDKMTYQRFLNSTALKNAF